MEKSEIIRRLEKIASHAVHVVGEKPFVMSLDDGIAVSEVLELLKEHEWHMLTEDDDGIIHGFPGDDGQYLMTDGKDIWIDDYVDGVADGIILDSGRDIREITAWMYIPELPKKNRR